MKQAHRHENGISTTGCALTISLSACEAMLRNRAILAKRQDRPVYTVSGKLIVMGVR